MKKYLITIILCGITLMTAHGQNTAQAKRILDKTAALINRRGGVSADFNISGKKIGSTHGKLALKGNKFQVTTPQAIVWYDGKTQWTLMRSTDEVNVTTPNATQKATINPYHFVSLYKHGYDLSMKTQGNCHQVRMKSQLKKQEIEEICLLINKKTYVPQQIKMLSKGEWTTVNVSNFKTNNLSDATFVFKSKDYPTAEIIDLR